MESLAILLGPWLYYGGPGDTLGGLAILWRTWPYYGEPGHTMAAWPYYGELGHTTESNRLNPELNNPEVLQK